jgi:tetratricopeptide (TPR) repeat protein
LREATTNARVFAKEFMTWKSCIEVLPKIAGSPLAIVAYVCLAGLWIFWLFRLLRSKVFIELLSKLPKNQRAQAAIDAGYQYDELAQLPKNQRLRLLTRRYLLIALLATLFVAGIIVIVAIIEGGKRARLEGELSQIDQARKRLERRLDDEKLGSSFLARGIERTSGAAGVSANPEIRAFANDLRTLLERFDKMFPPGERTPEDDIRVRLARATVANVESRFDDTLKDLTDADQAKAVERARLSHEAAVSIGLVRAGAFSGKHDWKSAKKCFEDVVSIDEQNWRAKVGIVDCIGRLGERSRALELLNGHIQRLQWQLKLGPDIVVQEALIQCYQHRAVLQRWLGRPSEALGDVDKVVKLRQGTRDFVITKKMADSWVQITSNAVEGARVDRGLILADLKRYSESFSDLDAAAKFYWTKVNTEGKAERRIDLAVALSLRGSVLPSLGRASESIKDMKEAVRIFRQLIDEEGRSELEENLASTLADKAIALRDLVPEKNTLDDFDESVRLRRKLVNGWRSELENDLASALTNRAIFLRATRKPANLDLALKSLNEAVDIRNRLIRNESYPELSNHLASSLTYRGLVLTGLDNASKALTDLDEAVKRRTELVEAQGRSELKDELAISLLARGAALEALARPNEAAADYIKASTITNNADLMLAALAAMKRLLDDAR